jgi:hypothetical protein
MLAIAINETTKNWIAKTFNAGVVPLYGFDETGTYTGEDNYYIVNDDSTTEIVGCETFWTRLFDQADEVITIYRKK